MTTAATLSSLVNSSNRIVVPSGGIQFADIQTAASGTTSEILDGYEEGTWTCATSGTVLNLSNISFNTSNYCKIGSLVIAFFSGSATVTTANARTIMYLTLPIGSLSTSPKSGSFGLRGPFSVYEINAGRVTTTSGTNDFVVEVEPARISNGETCNFQGFVTYTLF